MLNHKSTLIPLMILWFISGCVANHKDPNNLVLKNSPLESNEFTSIEDPVFRKRQKLIEEAFFGFDGTQGFEFFDGIGDNEAFPDNPEYVSMDIEKLQNYGSSNPGGEAFAALPLIWPTNGRITSLFGLRTLERVRRMHTGIDIADMLGTKIYAAANGQILLAGNRRGYGRVVVIGHDNHHETLYAHMSKMLVKTGQYVRQGQVIGLVGRTGHATGSHLHLELRRNGKPLNPIDYLPGKQILGKAGKGNSFNTEIIALLQSHVLPTID